MMTTSQERAIESGVLVLEVEDMTGLRETRIGTAVTQREKTNAGFGELPTR
jgi:hypothetical protein